MGRTGILLAVTGVLVLGASVYGAYVYTTLSADLSDSKQALQEETAQSGTLSKQLSEAKEYIARLEEALSNERNKNSVFENQIAKISGTVGVLEKLAKTDPELLAKYSKVFFLNENYSPPALSPIPEEYLYQKDRLLTLHAAVQPHLEELLDAAKEDDISLLIISAYRSFGTQTALKNSYRVTYGSGANTFSADQGYSEHQLGTTVDITTPAVGATFTGFDQTEAFKWLTENAWRYGFVLSYPKGNAYYQYEPWHWRFVGKDLARQLHRDEKYFYDLDQREIDEYLADIFD
ncbi:D-alanyl-D-alanine carboxypeptidase family protein [Patescibacteria group bacterium]|nr:D-alanyl-D-alanine carboxypeptidase family protein [Patescibacteria group bacterium]MBU1501023.1 D-alanyl-D-alanine carboxypeptidase family protein [Patescibacteria group bacterium]MBU2080653.1 D-alanyl-D-alanine carboxypeptidase family protein [Patescibacteria group bacterium]MBU2124272.1 D-alanyl-D-alanine carboxypeptidase family protein [Patescibacteria group bacterium]MBU2194398.1 D-alanyl-D-alanine carboxypeptidase family protein [Patescibacteria group bacterium]